MKAENTEGIYTQFEYYTRIIGIMKRKIRVKGEGRERKGGGRERKGGGRERKGGGRERKGGGRERKGEGRGRGREKGEGGPCPPPLKGHKIPSRIPNYIQFFKVTMAKQRFFPFFHNK
jgi:hypothetical protein